MTAAVNPRNTPAVTVTEKASMNVWASVDWATWPWGRVSATLPSTISIW